MNSIWKPSSLFLRSEFIFWHEHSVIEDVGDALVIVTPQNPFWRWGNLIVLKNPPRAEDADRWHKHYETKIAPKQAELNRIIIWSVMSNDVPDIESYIEDGLIFSKADVLLLGSLKRSPSQNTQVDIREIAIDGNEWNEVLEINIEGFGAGDATYPEYAERRFADHRSLIRKGAGRWYGAYINGELAGNLGIFAGEGLCRFQEVAVRPKFRRQGIASALVYHAASRAREEYPDYLQIIVADPKGDAIDAYRKTGFEKHSESHALIRPR
jgi:GNAT superfamily N-acetyltransferase